MKKTPKLPPTYLLITILVMIGVRFLFPLAVFIPPLLGLLGFVPLAVGVVIEGIADQAFRRAQTTVRPFEVSSKLVKDGVFQFSRNPMYLGFLLILCGVGVILGSALPFAAVALFLLLIDRKFVRREERMLEDRFGDEWRQYAARTRRWI